MPPSCIYIPKSETKPTCVELRLDCSRAALCYSALTAFLLFALKERLTHLPVWSVELRLDCSRAALCCSALTAFLFACTEGKANPLARVEL